MKDPRAIGRVVVVALLLLLTFTASASAHVKKRNLWSVTQAESIHTIRGVTFSDFTISCEGMGARKIISVNRSEGRVDRYATYHYFTCDGRGPLCRGGISGQRRIEYVLHPLGPYHGTSSRYAATGVWIHDC
jgi:hypothetical protein